jgi:NAD(P)-dependent dehydrogenase (short-subunit alcohol dehydrogenase family)
VQRNQSGPIEKLSTGPFSFEAASNQQTVSGYALAVTNFGKRSTAEEVSEGVDLTGLTSVVTGANTGIGFETARVMALRGSHVVMACRDPATANAARERLIASGIPEARLEVAVLDLASFESIRAFAEGFLASGRPLHRLINNAGVMIPMRRETEEGFEHHFGINHLGHFLLTNLLLEALRSAGGARVVCVSSAAMQFASLSAEFDDLNWEARKFSGVRSYGDSKLMNAMFANELTRRFGGEGIVANALHPGIIASTDLARDQPWYMGLVGLLVLPVAKDIPRGAATTVMLATRPEYASTGARYFGDCSEWKPMPLALDAQACATLWERSKRLTGLA